MNDDRSRYVSQAFNRWLERYSPPRSMAENERAQQDEADALMRAVLSFAPQRGFQEWTGLALDALSEACQTRAWPTVADVRKALKGVRYVPEGFASSATFDPVAINANRMSRGEPVPERFLWGRWAQRMMDAGVPKRTLDEYRKALHAAVFESRGEDGAMKWAEHVKARHREDLDALRNEQAGRVRLGRQAMPLPQQIAAYDWD